MNLMNPMKRHGLPVLGPFAALLGAQAVGTALGFGFWTVAAHFCDPREVGVAAGAIATQSLLGFLAALGVGTQLLVTLPQVGNAERRRLLDRGLLAVTLAALLLGGVAALAGSRGWLGSTIASAFDLGGTLAFVVGVVAAALAVVVDEASLGLQRPVMQVQRNLVASALRFAAAANLLLQGRGGATTLQWCWVAALAASVVFVRLRLRLRSAAPAIAQPWSADLRRHGVPALRHHGLTVAVAAATQAVPVVGALFLSPADNARFAVAWLVATLVYLVPYLLSVALFADAATGGGGTARARAARLRETARWTLPGALGVSTLLVVGAAVLGEPVMRIFGRDYAAEAGHLLALLAPAGLWMVLKDHLVAFWRAEERLRIATALCAVGLVCETVGAVVGVHRNGAEGLAIGWLVGIGVEALLFTPAAVRAWSEAPPVEPGARRRWVWLAAPSWLGVPGWWAAPAWPARLRRPLPALARRGGLVASLGASLLAAGVAVALVVAVLHQAAPTRPGWRTPSGAVGRADAAPMPTAGAAAGDCPAPPVDGTSGEGPMLDLGVQPAVSPTRTLDRRATAVLVRKAEGAGATVISTTVSWAKTQSRRNAPLQLGPAELVVQLARQAGLQVRVRLTGAPRWAVARGRGEYRPPVTGAERRAWQRFVARTLDRLGHVDYLEVWSEPDNPQFWPHPDAAAFGRLLAATRDVVRWRRDRPQLISGGLDGNDAGYLRDLLAWSDRSGHRLPMDLVGLHPFTGTQPPVTPASTGSSAEYTFLGYRDLLAEAAAAGHRDLGFYVTEFGYPIAGDLTDRVRADYVTEALRLLSCTPAVRALSWYYLHPTAYDPARWTLLDHRLDPNASYAALRAWYVTGVTGSLSDQGDGVLSSPPVAYAPLAVRGTVPDVGPGITSAGGPTGDQRGGHLPVHASSGGPRALPGGHGLQPVPVPPVPDGGGGGPRDPAPAPAPAAPGRGHGPGQGQGHGHGVGHGPKPAHGPKAQPAHGPKPKPAHGPKAKPAHGQGARR